VKRSAGIREGPEILATGSVFYPDTEDVMGWDISERGFRIVLSRESPRWCASIWARMSTPYCTLMDSGAPMSAHG